METSNPETPITPTDSQGGTLRQESTLPSSPVVEAGDQEMKLSHEKLVSSDGKDALVDSVEDVEDTVGMDNKAKALMHLLKTSSVWLCSGRAMGLLLLLM